MSGEDVERGGMTQEEIAAGLKQLQDALQQAMQKNIDPKKLEQAMQNMKQNEDQFRKSIERTRAE